MENKKAKNKIINFGGNVLFVILGIFVVFLIIISLGLALFLFESITSKDGYKDDWILIEEWRKRESV